MVSHSSFQNSAHSKISALAQQIAALDLALEDDQIEVLSAIIAKDPITLHSINELNEAVYSWLPQLTEIRNPELKDSLIDQVSITFPFISGTTRALLNVVKQEQRTLGDKEASFGTELLLVPEELLLLVQHRPNLIAFLKQIFLETEPSSKLQTISLNRLLKIGLNFIATQSEERLSNELDSLLLLCKKNSVSFTRALNGIDQGLTPEITVEFLKRRLAFDVIPLKYLSFEEQFTGDSKLAVLFSDIVNHTEGVFAESQQAQFKNKLAKRYKEVINLHKKHDIPLDKYHKLCNDAFLLFQKDLCFKEDLEDVLSCARFFVSEDLILEYLAEPSSIKDPSVQEFWTEWIHPDIFPTIPGEKQAKELLLKQTLQVMRRAYEMSYSFWNLKHEAQKISDSSPLFKRAICDLFTNVQEVINREPNSFPGKGWVFDSLNMRRAFSRNFREQYRNIAFNQQEAYDFEQLSSCRFGFVRGLIFVSNPASEKHVISGVHYSYVVFNEHLNSLPCERAFLVPTKELFSLIDQALTPVKGKLVKSSLFRSAHEVIPSPLSLYTNSIMPSANLTWSSNITGSLSNAFAAGVLANSWQNDQEIAGVWGRFHDENGFITKSFINQGWHNRDDLLEVKQRFAPLIRQHYQVYNVATSLQNHLDHFKLLLRQWHFGLTLSHEANARGEQELNFSDDADTKKSSFNPHATRLLYEAYKWHNAFGDSSQNPNPERCPVLSSCSTDGYGIMPDKNITLDTFSMILEIKHGDTVQRLKLDSGEKPSGLDILKWNSYVLNYTFTNNRREQRDILRDIWTDLRFFSREDLENGNN